MLGCKHSVRNVSHHVFTEHVQTGKAQLHKPSCCNCLLGFKAKTPQKAHSYWKGSKHVLIAHRKEKIFYKILGKTGFYGKNRSIESETLSCMEELQIYLKSHNKFFLTIKKLAARCAKKCCYAGKVYGT